MKKIRMGVIGNPARGQEFWDREKELEDMWAALETSSILLKAPRRFGKTSLMLQLVDHPRDGWQAFFLDVEWVKGSPEGFVAEVTTALIRDKKFSQVFKGARRLFGNLIDRIDEAGYGEFKISLRERLASDWQEKGRELIHFLKELHIQTILIIDEFPLLINAIAEEQDKKTAREFLSWLRGLRQMPDLYDKVRWVTGGSIGIEKVIQRVGAGTKEINDLHVIPVRELTDDSAHKFIKALLQNNLGKKRISPRIIGKMLEVIEIPIPYFIQILVRESLNRLELTGKQTLSEEIIEQAYEEGVLASYNRTYFENYHERLTRYYSLEMATAAKALLTEIARRSVLTKSELWTQFQAQMQGKADESTFSYLLSDLENDFYLICDRDRKSFRFATKVLRDWWLRYYAL